MSKNMRPKEIPMLMGAAFKVQKKWLIWTPIKKKIPKSRKALMDEVRLTRIQGHSKERRGQVWTTQ